MPDERMSEERLRELERAATYPPRSAPTVRLAECHELLIAELRAERERTAELERDMGIMEELVGKVYCELTGGVISKPNAEPRAVIDLANEEFRRTQGADAE